MCTANGLHLPMMKLQVVDDAWFKTKHLFFFSMRIHKHVEIEKVWFFSTSKRHTTNILKFSITLKTRVIYCALCAQAKQTIHFNLPIFITFHRWIIYVASVLLSSWASKIADAGFMCAPNIDERLCERHFATIDRNIEQALRIYLCCVFWMSFVA